MDCMMSGSVPAAMSCLAYAVRSEPGVTNFLTVRPGTPESFMPCAMTPSQNEAVSAGVSNTIQLISTGATMVGSTVGASVTAGASFSPSAFCASRAPGATFVQNPTNQYMLIAI